MLKALRLSTFLSRASGRAMQMASTISVKALRKLGDWAGEGGRGPGNACTLYVWVVYSCLTHCIPVVLATMCGARSPMMTKKAMHIPMLRPIVLQK